MSPIGNISNRWGKLGQDVVLFEELVHDPEVIVERLGLSGGLRPSRCFGQILG